MMRWSLFRAVGVVYLVCGSSWFAASAYSQGIKLNPASSKIGARVHLGGTWARWSRRGLQLRLGYKCLKRCASMQLKVVNLRGQSLTKKHAVRSVLKAGGGAVVVSMPWAKRRRLPLSWAETSILRITSHWLGKPQQIRLPLGKLMDGPKLSLLGQGHWYAGGTASFRVTVLRRRSGKPYQGAKVSATMKGPRGLRRRQRCVVDGGGVCQLRFPVKEAWVGANVKLRFVVTSDMGSRALKQTVSIHRKVRALLTSDKAIYQPGQRIYLRLLAMKMPVGRVLSGAKVRLVVKDGKGNQVFAKATTTNDFGIAHGVFALAKQVNQGSYLLMARVTTPGGKVMTSTKRVKVYRYRLPTFQVTIKPRRRFFLLSEAIAGKVSVQYLFGKAVAHADVKLDAWLQGSQAYRLFSHSGKTDASGHAAFRMPLSMSDVMAAQRRYAVDHRVLHIAAKVTAPGGEIQQAKATIPLATFPIQLKLVPEFSPLIPGLRQKIYVLTSLPDGSPVAATVKLRLGSAKEAAGSLTATTNKRGLGVLWFKPTKQKKLTLLASAKDSQGRKGRLSEVFRIVRPKRRRDVIVRPAHALYKEGDVVPLALVARPGVKVAGVDVFVGEQLSESHSVTLKDGKGSLSIRLRPSVHGLVRLVAYAIGADRGRRHPCWHVGWIYVQRAGDLTLDVTMDRPSYRPKQKATITFVARDEKARPVQAALGIQIVDRAVLALSGAPGATLRTYFRLKRAALASGVSIPGFGPEQLVFGAQKGKAWAHRRQAAAILLAASTPKVTYGLADNSELAYLRALGRRAARRGRYAIRIIARRLARRTFRYLYKLQQKSPCGLFGPYVGLSTLRQSAGLKTREVTDPWGRTVRFAMEPRRGGRYRISVKSLGFNGVDDGHSKHSDDIAIKISFRLKPKKVKRSCRGMGLRGIGTYGRGGWGYGGRKVLYGRGGMRYKGSWGYKARSGWSPGVVRHFFPELLFHHPSLITDRDGKARITVTMADNITTWQLMTLASTKDGRFGVHRASIRVAQPFFVSLRAPQALQRGDQITLPILIHNHRPKADKITVTLQQEPWFRLVSASASQQVDVAPQQVKLVTFVVQAHKAGDWFWKVKAAGSGVSDGLVQPVSVDPGGRPRAGIVAGYLDDVIRREIKLSKDALPGSGQLSLDIAPGPVAEQLGGLDSMLREPHGCFEQTSSTLYPNVMILKHYRSRKSPPMIAKKARKLVTKGYQRLLSFEVGRSGGFSLYGRAPARPVLTAYGLHEFLDMAKVHDVSPHLLKRIQGYLVKSQRRDGSWLPSSVFQSGRFRQKLRRLRHTAYAAWALGRVPRKLRHQGRKRSLARAMRFIKSRLALAKDAYTLALIGQVARAAKGQRKLLHHVMRELVPLRKTRGAVTWWRNVGGSLTGAQGRVAHVETTALAVSLLLQRGRYLNEARKGIGYLIKHRSPRGGWGTTQATIQVLQTLLLAQKKSNTDARGVVSVKINGATVKQLTLNASNADVFHKIDLSPQLQRHRNASVALHFQGKGRPTFQLRHGYRVPLPARGKGPARRQGLRLLVRYPKKTVAGKWHKVQLTIDNAGVRPAQQPIVKIGHPAGFSLQNSVLEGWVKSHRIERYERTAQHVVLYLKNLPPAGQLSLSYAIRAAHPQIVSPPLSSLYEYYRPQQMIYASSPPIATE